MQAYARRIRGDRVENQQRAIDIGQRVLGELSRESDPLEWVLTRQTLANAYSLRTTGDRYHNLLQAIALCKEALEVATRQAMPELWILITMTLGNLYRDLPMGRAKNLERAIALYQQALEVANQETMPASWALIKMNLGNAYAHRIGGDRKENLEQAIHAYEDALRVRTLERGPIKWAETMNDLATTYSSRVRGDRLENLNRAVAGYREVLRVMTREGMPIEHRITQRALGSVMFMHQHWEEAASAFDGALSATDLLYRAAATPKARQAELAETADMPAKLAYSLAKTSRLSEAAVAMENGRARSMAEMLALDEASLNGLRPEDKDEFERIREQIHKLQSEARLPENAPGYQEFLMLSANLRQAYADMERIIAAIRTYQQGFLPQTSFEMMKEVAAKCPLVYLLATDAGGLSLIVEASGKVKAVWLQQLITAELNRRVREYLYWSMQQRNQSGEWLDNIETLLRWLWVAVMGPVMEALSSEDAAVFIPAGLLGLLPLHAAWIEDAGTQTARRYACDAITFHYAPSARSNYSALKAVSGIVPNAILAVDDPSPVHASPLPNSAFEVQAAVSGFPQSRILAHEEATRRAVLDLLADYSVLHFSCHGTSDFTEPLNGGLVMANDQFLTLRDFLDVRMSRTRLVVLSACATAISGLELPDEVLSLPAGLLQAGASGVAGTLWSVSDASTMMLMARFYELWQLGDAPAKALRQSQLWLRDTTNRQKAEYFRQLLADLHGSRMPKSVADFLYKSVILADPEAKGLAHPYYWGGFAYFGV